MSAGNSASLIMFQTLMLGAGVRKRKPAIADETTEIQASCGEDLP